MRTTEEEDQQNEIKLAYERNGMDKQIKNIQKGSKNICIIQQRHNLTRKLVISVKESKCTVYISIFQIVNNQYLHQFSITSITYLIVRTFSLILGRLITNARIFTLFLCSYISPSNIPYFFRESSLLVGIKGISFHSEGTSIILAALSL